MAGWAGQEVPSPAPSPLCALLRMARLAVGAIRYLSRAVPWPLSLGALVHGTMLLAHLGLVGLHHAVVCWGVGVEPLGCLLGGWGHTSVSFLPAAPCLPVTPPPCPCQEPASVPES